VQSLLDRDYECLALQGSRLVAWEDFEMQERQLKCLADGERGTASHRRYINDFLVRPDSSA
jgi:hypothetical protein